MSMIRQLHCRSCGPVPAQWQGANHVLHLLATIFTGGLWLIPWMFIATSGHWVCPKCGLRIKAPQNAFVVVAIILLAMFAAFVAFVALSPAR